MQIKLWKTPDFKREFALLTKCLEVGYSGIVMVNCGKVWGKPPIFGDNLKKN